MVILLEGARLIGHEPRKKLGFSQDYGHALFGYVEFGADNPWAGIYRKYTNDYKNHLIKMRHYVPSYSSSPAIIASRASFASAISAWQALDALEKSYFERWGKKYKMSGYNKYISEYMKGNIP